jgi:sirohydrochlorin ferrochelatase
MIASNHDFHQPHRRTVALALAAHGSSHDARCAAPVLRHADRLRALGRFAEVHAVFWKQPPFFRHLLGLTEAPRVVVVPVMTAEGYYAAGVLPRELGLDDPQPGRDLRLAPAIGSLEEMADLIIAQACEAAARDGFGPRDAHLVVVGHGTRREAQRSGATTTRHAGAIARRAIFRRVVPAFLEQDPDIPTALDGLPARERVIIVPFLIASGTHAADDIPRLAQAATGARLITFAEAVGEHPGLADLILAAADRVLPDHVNPHEMEGVRR